MTERVLRVAAVNLDLYVIDVKMCFGVTVGDTETNARIGAKEIGKVDTLMQHQFRRVVNGQRLCVPVCATIGRYLEGKFGTGLDIVQAVVEYELGCGRTAQVYGAFERVIDAAAGVELDAAARGVRAIVGLNRNGADWRGRRCRRSRSRAPTTSPRCRRYCYSSCC